MSEVFNSIKSVETERDRAIREKREEELHQTALKAIATPTHVTAPLFPPKSKCFGTSVSNMPVLVVKGR